MGTDGLRNELIDAALRVCIERGHQATTVARIADAADVTVPEVTSVFATADAALLATIEDILHAVVDTLPRPGPAANGARVLREATTRVISDVAVGRGVIPRHRLADVARVMVAAPALRAASRDLRFAILAPALAEHLGTHPDDRAVQHAITTWSAVVAASYNPGHHTERYLASNPVLDGRRPEVMADRLGDTFDHITEPSAYRPVDGLGRSRDTA